MTALRRRAAWVVTAALLATGLAAADAQPSVAEPTTPTGRTACVTPAHAFTPKRASIPAIDSTVRVVGVRRTRSGAVGTPPVSKRGKWLMGIDPQARPGDGEGTVIMVAHTWPDGSALGNAFLRSLQTGDRLTLSNGDGSANACYQVTQRKQYAAKRVPRRKAYRWWGPEQLVIVVCSGKRLGPGNWSKRTVWYATPVAD